MKKIYESLQIEVIAFDKKDVITASGAENINEIENAYFTADSMKTPDDLKKFFENINK